MMFKIKKVDIKANKLMTKVLRNNINHREMLNVTQERKHCNRLAIISSLNTIPFQQLTGGHFGVDVKRNGDHFGVGIISGSIWGSFPGQGHLRGCTMSISGKYLF